MDIKKLQYDPKDRDSIFWRVGCQEEETLSNVIAILDWGNNKRIRGGGFLISHSVTVLNHPDYDAIGRLKQNMIKDPYFKFKKGRTYISPKNGKTIAVIIIK